jgi:predicted outer membrane repeat protein
MIELIWCIFLFIWGKSELEKKYLISSHGFLSSFDNTGSLLSFYNFTGTIRDLKYADASLIRIKKTQFIGSKHSSYFRFNKTKSFGEIVYDDLTSTIYCNGTLESGISVNGGAIYANNAVLTFKDEFKFKNNQAFESGGAIFIYNGSVLVFENAVIFESNEAVVGGAFRSISSTITFLSNVDILLNKAESGCGFYVEGENNLILFNSNVTINENQSKHQNIIYNSAVSSVKFSKMEAVFLDGKLLFPEKEKEEVKQ